jgi:hypothetical protein
MDAQNIISSFGATTLFHNAILLQMQCGPNPTSATLLLLTNHQMAGKTRK